MSVAEVEQQVLQLTEEERREFAAWFYRNESKFLPSVVGESSGEENEALRAELLLRKQEYFDSPERFQRVNTRSELKAYFDEVRDEVRNRLSPAR